jgi:hypothetical protein
VLILRAVVYGRYGEIPTPQGKSLHLKATTEKVNWFQTVLAAIVFQLLTSAPTGNSSRHPRYSNVNTRSATDW